MTLPVVFTANGPSGYNLTKSLRFRSSASAYLSKTWGANGSSQTFTISAWVKRGALGSIQAIVTARQNGLNNLGFRFTAANVLELYAFSGGSLVTNLITTQVFRDPSAWYHVLFAVDTTQATSTNRVKFYVNGTQITAFSTATYPSLNATTLWNQTAATHYFATYDTSSELFDGYMAEINVIDGQALTPSSFGETSTTTGVWQPKKYTGTYGTNGFYLPFTDTTSTSTLGTDFSGNSNTWTVNNISLTSGVTYDSMTDVPTNTSATVANYPVLNAVSAYSGLPITNANIQTSAVPSGSNWFSRSTTMGISSGKWYAEFSMPSITSGNQGNPVGFGIIPASNDFSAAGQLVGDSNRGYGFYCPDTASNNPQKRVAGTSSSIGTASVTLTTDIFMVAFDLTNGNAWFGKNGTWYAGDPAAGTSASITGITAGEYLFGLSVYRDATFTNNTAAINFGQRPFSYTPPTGFVALNTFNLPTPTIGATSSSQANKYFNAVTYTGAGAGTVITTGFYPDFAWMKNRTAAFSNFVQDSVRGGGVYLLTDTTDADAVVSPSSTFSSTGITINANSSYASNSSYNFVAWAWNANSGSTVSNTAGSITSTVSANTTAGFSIVTWSQGASSGTVGHGLGVAPSMIIGKTRSNSGFGWHVYHSSLGVNKYLFLNLTNGETTSSGIWSTLSSTVFGASTGLFEANQTQVAYCFAPIAGYSAFGSYTGNGSTDGPFVYLGFRPRFVMVKASSSASNWFLWDTARNTYNATTTPLFPNLSSAEEVTLYPIDVLSNGFKLRGASGLGINENALTYIYACFAENPFKYSNAR